MGWLFARQKDHEQAMLWYREALRVDPGHRLALNNMGAALMATGRPEEGMDYYRRAMQTPAPEGGR
jgi:Tfp pilus assembly protein PilF